MPTRVTVKRIEKYFDALKYILIIYYHKDLSIKDIYNRMIKKEEGLEEYKPDTEGRDEAIIITHTDGISYLVLNSKTPISTILHEVVHITTALFDFMGVQHNEGNDEIYAYNAQHIFEFILSTMLYDLKVPLKNLLDF